MSARMWIAGLTALLVVLSGCSGSASEERQSDTAAPTDTDAATQTSGGTAEQESVTAAPPSEAFSWDPRPADQVWSVDLSPLSRAVVVDDVALLFVDDEADSFSVAAVDTASGELLWQAPTSPGRSTAGLAGPAVLDSGDDPVVVVRERSPYESEDDWWAPLVALDLHTGEQLAESAEVVADGPISACHVDSDAAEDAAADAVCFAGYVGSAEESLDYTATLNGAELSITPHAEEGDGQGDGSAEDADGTWASWSNFDFGFFTDAEGVEHYARQGEDGEMVWTTPVLEVTGDHDGPRTGGITRNAADAFAITRYDLVKDGDTQSLPIGDQQVVALDKETGEVLWHEQGVLGCFLPTAYSLGGSLEGDDPEEASASGEHDAWRKAVVMCQGTGTAAIDSNGRAANFAEVDLQIQGRDADTGTVLWSREFAGAEDLLNQDFVVAVPGSQEVLDLGEGPVLSDRLTGEPVVLPPGLSFLCAAANTFDYPGPTLEGEDRTTSPLAYPCSLDGEPLDTPPSRSAVAEGGYRLTDTYLVTTADGLTAYDQ